MASTSALNAPANGVSSREPSREDFGNKDLLRDKMLASPESLTPWVIDVDAGQDVMKKISEFCKQVPDQTVCIISAIGNLSEIAFSVPFIDKITYEGLFDILKLSGSFEPVNCEGRERKSRVTISFALSDGRVKGGMVVGQLKAANVVRIIVGTFKTSFKKVTKKKPVSLCQKRSTNMNEGNDAIPSKEVQI